MDLDAYFERIGYRGPREPTLDVLAALVARQTESIPFEAIDVLLGRTIDIATEAIFDKLVHRKRGGYCFEQNGLLRQALRALGFDAEPLIARVLWMRAATAPLLPPTHTALRVRIDGRDYLADAGFGNGTPTAPLSFATDAPQATPLETFRLLPVAGGHLLEVRAGELWMPVYEIIAGSRSDEDFARANVFASTSPESRFRQVLILARATKDARSLLLGNQLTIRPAKGKPERLWFKTPDELRHAVETIFGLSPEPEWQPIFELFTSPDMQVR